MPGTVTGAPLFAKVQKGEEAFQGRYARFGPDIVCTPADWRYQVFGYQDFVSNRFVETYAEMTGHHRPDGIFFALGKPFVAGKQIEEARLLDVAPTLLHLLGLPIPSDMDGRVLEEIFTDDAWQYPDLLPGHASHKSPEGQQPGAHLLDGDAAHLPRDGT